MKRLLFILVLLNLNTSVAVAFDVFSIDSCEVYLETHKYDSLKEYLDRQQTGLAFDDRPWHLYYLALYYRFSYDYVNEMHCLLEGYKLVADISGKEMLAANYLDEFAIIYKKQDASHYKEKALESINESIRIKRGFLSDSLLAKSYFIKGNIFFTMQDSGAKEYDFDSVKHYHKLAYEEALLKNNTAMLSFINKGQIAIATLDGRFDNLESNYKKVIAHEYIKGNPESAANNLNNLARLYLEQNRLDDANCILDTLLDHVVVHDWKLRITKVLASKVKLAKKENDYKTALMWQDSMFRFKSTYLNKELEEIVQKSNIDNLESELIQKKNRLSINRLWLLLAGGAILFLCIGMYVLNKYSGLKRKALEQEIKTTKIKAVLDTTRAKMEGEQKEREAIASVLHDQVASLLTAADLHLKVARKKGATVELEKAASIIKEINSQVRDLSHQLVSPTLLKFGLESGIDSLVERMSTADLDLVYSSSIGSQRFSAYMENFVYQSCSELIHNTMKHSDADKCWITLEYEKANIKLTVRNNGISDMSRYVKSGLGLTHLKLKSESMGGHFSFELTSSSAVSIVTLPVI